MRRQEVVCDGCGKVKQETNNWWKAGADARGPLLLVPFDFKWEEEADWDQRWDLCGQACVVGKLSEWMNPKQETVKVGESYLKATSEIIHRSDEEIWDIVKDVGIRLMCDCGHLYSSHTKGEGSRGGCAHCDCGWQPK